MSRFNTGNKIDSDDLKDLSDNAKNADMFSNDRVNQSYKDRFGVRRKTIHGMETEFKASQDYREKRFNDFIVDLGYVFVGDYAPGVTLSEYNQIVRDDSGEFWRVSGSSELPYTLTGEGVDEGGALVSVGDASLRGDLRVNGFEHIGDIVGVIESEGELAGLDPIDGSNLRVRGEGGFYFYYSETPHITYQDDKWNAVTIPNAKGFWIREMLGLPKLEYFLGGGDEDLGEIVQFCVDNFGGITTSLTSDSEFNQTKLISVIGKKADINLNGIRINFTPEEDKYEVAMTVKGSFGESFGIQSLGSGVSSITVPSEFDIDSLLIGSSLLITGDGKAFKSGREYDTKIEIFSVIDIDLNSRVLTLDGSTSFNYTLEDNAEVKVMKLLDGVRVSGYSPERANRESSRGILVELCKNFEISNCSPENFHNSCIEVNLCDGGKVFGNSPKLTRVIADLDYGITVYRSRGIDVYDNNPQSPRTAIDITRLSHFCRVYNNNTYGNINTHVAYCVDIFDNFILDGGILLRAARSKVLNNSVRCGSKGSSLSISEAALDDWVVVSGNTFEGTWRETIIGDSLVEFSGNTIIVDKFIGVNFNYMINLNTGYRDVSDRDVGLSIVGNTVSNRSGYSFGFFNTSSNTYQRGIRVKDNLFYSLGVCLDLSPLTDSEVSRSLTVNNNKFIGCQSPIRYRLTDFVSICNNEIFGHDSGSSISWMPGGSSNRVGLIISGNMISSGAEMVLPGDGRYKEPLIKDNIIELL